MDDVHGAIRFVEGVGQVVADGGDTEHASPGSHRRQARDEAKLDFHFNMSLAAVNLARLVSAQSGLSLNSYVRREYNRFVVEQLLVQLGLEAEYDLNGPLLRPIIDIGRMAA